MATFNPTFTEDELQSEEWRAVVGLEGYYQVSSLGRVRRDPSARKTRGRFKPGHIISAKFNTGGYLKVFMSKWPRHYTPFLHAIVAAAFIGPRPDGQQIDHIDFDRTNNRAANLQYVTRARNMERSVKAGRIGRGEARQTAKLTAGMVRALRARYAAGGVPMRVLAVEFGISEGQTRCVIRRLNWKHVE